MSKRGKPTGKRGIYQRDNTFYARLTVPQDVRDHFGQSELWKSLQTDNLKTAEYKAAQIVNEWKIQIERFRGETTTLSKALEWKATLAEERRRDSKLISKLVNSGREVTSADVDNLGIGTDSLAFSDAIDKVLVENGDNEASLFVEIAKGKALPTKTYIEEYKASLKVIPRTLKQIDTHLNRFDKRFPSLPIKKSDVAKWILELEADGKAEQTVKKHIGSCRSYYEFLMRLDYLDPDSVNPFDKPKYTKKKKVSRSEIRQAWEVEDIIKLEKAALEKKDDANLHDLIILGAYTGARIEEIVALKVEQVKQKDGVKYFEIGDSKSEAGLRDLPVHKDILPLVDYLVENSSDGYLLPEESITANEERSSAVGKAFGRLKTKLGFDARYVFHSMRKTLSTLLEREGYHHNQAAEITGHEKVGETYGTYSAGLTVPQKADLLNKITYEGLNVEPKRGKRTRR